MTLSLPDHFIDLINSTFQEGETFIQVTKLLQGYIENEVDMNPSQNCKSQCSGKVPNVVT